MSEHRWPKGRSGRHKYRKLKLGLGETNEDILTSDNHWSELWLLHLRNSSINRATSPGPSAFSGLVRAEGDNRWEIGSRRTPWGSVSGHLLFSYRCQNPFFFLSIPKFVLKGFLISILKALGFHFLNHPRTLSIMCLNLNPLQNSNQVDFVVLLTNVEISGLGLGQENGEFEVSQSYLIKL